MEVQSRFTGRRGVSLPFSDFTGPLWGEGSSRDLVLRELCKFADQEKWKHLELRGGLEPSRETPAHRVFEGHELDLSGGLEVVGSKLAPSTRRAVRKAERSQLDVRIGSDSQSLEEFYNLHSRTRKRHGLPPQPISFFRSIQSYLLEEDLGEVVLAYLGKVAIAGAVFFFSAGKALYKFGASESRYWSLRPNHLVMWRAIQHLVSKGCKSLHFGRTDMADSGLIRFKRSWGGESLDLPYFRRENNRPAWICGPVPSPGGHPSIFGHLPLSLNRFAGRLIYPHLD
jgi:hypothetical protein